MTSCRTQPSTWPWRRGPRPRGLDPVVFGVPAALAVAFVVWGFIDAGSLDTASGKALTWVMDNMGWLFVLTSSAFVVFVIWLASAGSANPARSRRRGAGVPDGLVVAMMFCAGMGIGLCSRASASRSPTSRSPRRAPVGPRPEAAQAAMRHTLFHWTLHPWAIYAVVGLAIAYGVYREAASS